MNKILWTGLYCVEWTLLNRKYGESDKNRQPLLGMPTYVDFQILTNLYQQWNWTTLDNKIVPTITGISYVKVSENYIVNLMVFNTIFYTSNFTSNSTNYSFRNSLIYTTKKRYSKRTRLDWNVMLFWCYVFKKVR